MYQSLYINFSIQLSYVIPSDIAKNLDVDSLNKNIQNEFDKNNIIRNDNEQENIKVDDDFEYSYPPKIGYNFNVNTEVTKKWNSDIGLIKNIDGNNIINII